MSTQTIRPLTRVEGLGEVRLVWDGTRLAEVQLRISEAPRLFESLLRGRQVEEVPALVSRICAICATPHALAAILALEQALNLTPPPAARLIRELALLGDLIQSHALHLFALVLPDQRGVPSLVPLLQAGDREALAGLELKQFGNRLQELFGGRLIHPVTLQLGGVRHRPSAREVAALIDPARSWQRRLKEWCGLFDPPPGSYAPAAPSGTPLAVAGSAPLCLWGETLRGGEASLPVRDYRTWLPEQTLADSTARRVRHPEVCWRTGALSRCQLATPEVTFPGSGIFANNLAQLHELDLALERVVVLCEKLLQLEPGALLAHTPRMQSGLGTIALEAPRGTLIHQYGVDDGGRIVTADIITPTTINQVAIEAQLFADLARLTPSAQLKARAEQIVRAFDPCISCAVHLIRI